MKKILLLTVFGIGIGTQAIAGFGEAFDAWEKDSGIPLQSTLDVYKANKTVKNAVLFEKVIGIRPLLDETNHGLFDEFANHRTAKSNAADSWAQILFQAVEEGKITSKASYREFKKANYTTDADENFKLFIEDFSLKKLRGFITAVESAEVNSENLLEKKNVGPTLTAYNESILSLITELKVKEVCAPLERMAEERKERWEACVSRRLSGKSEEEKKKLVALVDELKAKGTDGLSFVRNDRTLEGENRLAVAHLLGDLHRLAPDLPTHLAMMSMVFKADREFRPFEKNIEELRKIVATATQEVMADISWSSVIKKKIKSVSEL
jgi:hypothetical protein